MERNLRGEGVDTVDDAVLWGYTAGPKVVPGTYEVRLDVADGPTMSESWKCTWIHEPRT